MSSFSNAALADAARKGSVDPLGQPRPVADLGDERQGVVVAADLVVVGTLGVAFCKNTWKRPNASDRSVPSGPKKSSATCRMPEGHPVPARKTTSRLAPYRRNTSLYGGRNPAVSPKFPPVE